MKNWKKREKTKGRANGSFLFSWLEWAEGIAYGPLALKPNEFYALSPFELTKLATGYERRKLNVLWTASYFTANLMATQVKGITPEKLMKPFLPRKTSGAKEAEREEFFKEFYAQRKEADECQP